MQELYPILQNCPLFDGIRPEDLPGMLGCLGAKPVRAKKGQTIFHEGDTTVFIGIALTGSLLLLLSDTASRCLGSGSALPVGAITSLLGAPFFIAIIFMGKENRSC